MRRYIGKSTQVSNNTEYAIARLPRPRRSVGLPVTVRRFGGRHDFIESGLPLRAATFLELQDITEQDSAMAARPLERDAPLIKQLHKRGTG